MPTSRDSIKDIWGERTPHADGEWPARVDERTLEKPEKWVQSACVLCSTGCGLLQMNGQPTSENTRETGCDGEFPAFRNWHNPDHLYDLAERYSPPLEEPDDKYPFRLTTGRVVYHWHTRTKTARSVELQDAEPEAFVELSKQDAERLGIQDGDPVEVASRRGSVRAPARVGPILPGHVFIPFHYGYWDEGGDDEHARAANELTITAWDPVSKQPYFKYAAVQVHKVGSEGVLEKVAAAGKALDKASELTDTLMSSAHVERSRVSDYIGVLAEANEEFAKACASVASHHPEEAEIQMGMKKLSEFSAQALALLRPFTKNYGEREAEEPNKLRTTLFPALRAGSFGVLRDLHDLYVMAAETHIALTIVMQASKELRDEQLLDACIEMDELNKRQQAWLMTQIEHRAPHTLVVPQ
jgi:ferredoxin-nitrate reductase